MLQDFIDWLSGQTAEHGLGKVLLSTTALLGVAGSVGTLFGSLPLRAAALIVVLLAALTLTVFLLTERGAVRRELTTASKLLQTYCELLQNGSRVRLEIAHWVQTVVINQRGDAIVSRRITLTPADDELRFLACNLRYYGATRLTSRTRRLVTATAREMSADGTEGARLVTMSFWRDDTEHQIHAHFSTPVAAGNEVSVEVQWVWPLYSMDLMQGGVEDFDVTFDHPVDTATHKIVLLKRTKNDRFVASRIGRLAQFESHVSNAAYHATFVAERPKPATRYGIRIDKAH